MSFANDSSTLRRLRHSVQRDLNVYALAAGAAGVGLLALTQPAQAEIVYTPAHSKFKIGGSGWIDLNQDGVNDFRIGDAPDRGLGSTTFVFAFGLHPGNEVRLGPQGKYAQPLPAGVTIGPSNIFSRSATMALAYNGFGGGTWGKNHYLGLQFDLNGEKHYGWAELSIALNTQRTITVEIEGYAYETVANKPIRAGETKAPDNASKHPIASTPTAAHVAPTLGLLALGACGLSVWRRED